MVVMPYEALTNWTVNFGMEGGGVVWEFIGEAVSTVNVIAMNSMSISAEVLLAVLISAHAVMVK